MDKELIALLYQAEEAGLIDADISDLEIIVDDQPITSVSLLNTGSLSELPDYVFWSHDDEGNYDVEVQLTDEQKITIFKEVLAWY